MSKTIGKTANRTGMSLRLGNILYWLCCLAAFPFVFWVSVNAMLLAGFFGGTALPGENALDAFGATLGAIVLWLVGRGLRYILAGK